MRRLCCQDPDCYGIGSELACVRNLQEHLQARQFYGCSGLRPIETCSWLSHSLGVLLFKNTARNSPEYIRHFASAINHYQIVRHERCQRKWYKVDCMRLFRKYFQRASLFDRELLRAPRSNLPRFTPGMIRSKCFPPNVCS
jgi:hypothetical protein